MRMPDCLTRMEGKRVRAKRLISAVAVAGAAAVMLTASPASADVRNWEGYAGTNATCYGTGGFDMAFYYNSSAAGAQRYFGYPEGDFNELGELGSTSAGPATFCSGGNGAGQRVKNNAASVRNAYSVGYARVYYNSWFQGNSDIVERVTWRNLSPTIKNNNASFQWLK